MPIRAWSRLLIRGKCFLEVWQGLPFTPQFQKRPADRMVRLGHGDRVRVHAHDQIMCPKHVLEGLVQPAHLHEHLADRPVRVSHDGRLRGEPLLHSQTPIEMG